MRVNIIERLMMEVINFGGLAMRRIDVLEYMRGQGYSHKVIDYCVFNPSAIEVPEGYTTYTARDVEEMEHVQPQDA